MTLEAIFESAFEYLNTLTAPIVCITIVALADEIFQLAKRSILAAKLRSRRR